MWKDDVKYPGLLLHGDNLNKSKVLRELCNDI